MPPILQLSMAAARSLSRRWSSPRCLSSLTRRPEGGRGLEPPGFARCSSSSARRPPEQRPGPLADIGKQHDFPTGISHRTGQSRRFLGCGDGAEGHALSRTHEERRVLGYSPEQLYAVVSAVDMYEDFLPWCQRSKIIRRNSNGSFDAELEIGFKFFVERYISHVDLKKPSYIKSSSSDSSLFDHLINIWEFNPGPLPGTCELHFLVDFKFHSPLYSQVASVFFKEVVSRLVSSFSDRCYRIYGPGVQVLENAYGQSA